jgi:hypothetical protein
MIFDHHIAVKEESKVHVDFEPKSAKERNAFHQFMNEELLIRLPEPEHNERLQYLMQLEVEEKKEALRKFGQFEATISMARRTVK